ncbi:LAMI_0G15698g1_1 [Lachancea mirantina]|uniref:LAMI_0G15698g1_1 n=1 Tax=Lachancea mirantina TaxID=1230905 RepID=A0A1G4KCG1_9SACH|nr:LAMI_0G15698g1_1 [Lachancea mirantina]
MSGDSMDVDHVPEADGVVGKQTSVDETFELLEEISKTSTSLDPRYVWRSLRDLSQLRVKLDKNSFSIIVNLLYPDDSPYKVPLLKYINQNQKSTVEQAKNLRDQYPATFYQVASNNRLDVSAELNSFVHLLTQLYLLDSQQFEELSTFNRNVVIPKVLKMYNKRTLDLIQSKLWFYISRGEEILNTSGSSDLRSEMIKYLKTATLRHDNETRAMLITLILRNYLNDGAIELAADFVSKVEFPASSNVSSPIEARYYFYLSKISAIQLEYTVANDYVVAAIRKAPTTRKSLGFLQQANKLHCVIQLLMGDIPALSFFNQEGMQRSLLPYYHLSKAVKLGDLNKFTSAISSYKADLIKDDNYQLCVRLRSNVIKTGIRIISLTYKKISLKDICLKLRLDSEQTVEYMVSRAIRDGVIEATINHKDGYIESSELLNIYATKEPQASFDERIKFVNQLHDDCVKAMRYPEGGDKKDRNKAAVDGDQMEEIIDFSDLDEDDLGDFY